MNHSSDKGSKICKTFTGNKVPPLTKAIYHWYGIFSDDCYKLEGTFLIQ